MIKICGNSLCKLLEMTFKPCITKGEFSSEWNKANAVPVHTHTHTHTHTQRDTRRYTHTQHTRMQTHTHIMLLKLEVFLSMHQKLLRKYGTNI